MVLVVLRGAKPLARRFGRFGTVVEVDYLTMHVSVRRPENLEQVVEDLGQRSEISAVRVGEGESG